MNDKPQQAPTIAAPEQEDYSLFGRIKERANTPSAIQRFGDQVAIGFNDLSKLDLTFTRHDFTINEKPMSIYMLRDEKEEIQGVALDCSALKRAQEGELKSAAGLMVTGLGVEIPAGSRRETRDMLQQTLAKMKSACE